MLPEQIRRVVAYPAIPTFPLVLKLTSASGALSLLNINTLQTLRSNVSLPFRSGINVLVRMCTWFNWRSKYVGNL